MAFGQAGGSASEVVYPTDAYGNVQPVEGRWRPIGSFANDAERDAYQGYQTLTRRFGQRSGLEPFALPGDVWSVARLAATGTDSAPSVKPVLTPAKRKAFRRYGGFGARERTTDPDEPSDLLTRRHGLISATAHNAPIYRAMTRSNMFVDLRSAVVRTPFLAPDVEPSSDAPPTLDERFDVTDRFAHQRLREEAWTLFREARYREAVGAFETAITLEPADHEARLGEIFTYLSLGARRTALALFGELVRRDEALFQHPLRVRERYGNVADANALQIQARPAAEDANQNDDVNALYTLVLWYLGVEEDALRAAEALAKRGPGKPYALWPDKMRAARASSQRP